MYTMYSITIMHLSHQNGAHSTLNTVRTFLHKPDLRSNNTFILSIPLSQVLESNVCLHSITSHQKIIATMYLHSKGSKIIATYNNSLELIIDLTESQQIVHSISLVLIFSCQVAMSITGQCIPMAMIFPRCFPRGQCHFYRNTLVSDYVTVGTLSVIVLVACWRIVHWRLLTCKHCMWHILLIQMWYFCHILFLHN